MIWDSSLTICSRLLGCNISHQAKRALMHVALGKGRQAPAEGSSWCDGSVASSVSIVSDAGPLKLLQRCLRAISVGRCLMRAQRPRMTSSGSPPGPTQCPQCHAADCTPSRKQGC